MLHNSRRAASLFWTHSLLPCTWPSTASNQALHTIGGNNTHIVSSSWCWAYKCPKHVECIISAIKHSVTSSWFFFYMRGISWLSGQLSVSLEGVCFTQLLCRIYNRPGFHRSRRVIQGWRNRILCVFHKLFTSVREVLNPYPTAFPYGNGMVLHFYQQQESSTTKTVHKVINKGLKTYV